MANASNAYQAGRAKSPRVSRFDRLLQLNMPPKAEGGTSLRYLQKLARQQLKKEILPLIQRYNSGDNAPPFSTAELIVMAIICAPLRSANKEKIFYLICDRFKFYGRKVLLAWASRVPNGEKAKCSYEAVIEDFNEAFGEYEVPLWDATCDSPGNADTECFAVLAREARCFLRKVLQPSPKEPFRFMELPAELRARIYEMLFSFPTIAFGDTSHPEKDKSLILYRREHDSDLPDHREPWIQHVLHSRPMQTILALLSVNKSLYMEAVPYFYRVNTFRMFGMRDLGLFVQCLAPSRLEYVRHISFDYDPEPASGARQVRQATVALGLHKALVSVELRTTDKRWFQVQTKRKGVSVDRYPDPSDLPGMRDLCRLFSGLDRLTLDGECPRIEGYIRAQMEELKSDVQLTIMGRADVGMVAGDEGL